MTYSVLIYPHQGLATTAKPVEVFDEALQELVNDLLETMYSYKGIGLAASQVNVQQRIFVMDTSDDQSKPQCLINPVITHRSGLAAETEGCLSFPHLYIDVERAEHIKVSSQDASGKQQETEASGLLARCIQHELDHLDGVVFVDRLSRMKRERALKKYQKLRRQSGEA